jgi:hypothetical protein
MNQKIALVLILLFGAGLNSFAQTNSTPGAPTAGIVAATKKFLATLDDAQREKRNENQSAGEIEFTFHPFRPKIAVSAGPT